MIEICRRLDGIALAIELAAARLVSMSAQDVRDRLGDRFRLLSGSRRGLERHQTLRQVVGWSYYLLNDDERALLARCAMFADGFDVAAVTQVCGAGLDEFVVLDVLDSLVRKSLVTVEHVEGPLPVTGCWRPSASSPRNNWPPPVMSALCVIATPVTSPIRRSPIGVWMTGLADVSPWTGWTGGWTTCAPGSAGPPTRGIWPLPFDRRPHDHVVHQPAAL